MTALQDARAPKAPQQCLACSVMVQTYEQWFTEDCPSPQYDWLGHDVPGYLELPNEEVTDGSNN